MAIALATQSVGDYVSLAWMIVNLQVVVLDQFKPSTLPHVQIFLSEEVLQVLVVGVDITLVPNQVVSPNLQGMHNGFLLKIMGRVTLFVLFQLAGCLSNDFPILH